MKKLLLLLGLLFFAHPAWGQQLSIHALVIDPNGRPYANGTAHASLVCTGNAQAYYGTTPIARDTPTVGMDGFGNLVQTLYDTSVLVDVNQNPLACNYVYRITENCGIANFSTGPLTGITGAGPVDLGVQISSYSVPLSPQCTPGGGGGVVSFASGNLPPLFTTTVTNPNTNVTQAFNLSNAGAYTLFGRNANSTGAPSYFQLPQTFWTSANETASLPNSVQIHAGTNISFTTAANSLTINSTGGGGSGCIPNGGDLAVQTEHPATPTPTCYGSQDFIWNDASTVNSLTAGDGTNTPGPAFAFIYGEHNNLGTGTSQAIAIGDNNTFTNGTELYAYGEGNTITGLDLMTNIVSEAFVLGTTNTVASIGNDGTTQNNFVMGANNYVKAADCVILGENSLITPSTSGYYVSDCGILGHGNNLGFTGAGAGYMTDMYFIGDGNIATESTGGAFSSGMNQVHVLGDGNSFEDDLNATVQVEVVGEFNDVDGALSTLQILGFKNVAHNVTKTATDNADTTIVGADNSVSNVVATDGKFAFVGGDNLTLSNCDDCYMFGANGVSSASNTVSLGISATPEISITPGAVKVTTLTASNPVCTNSSNVLVSGGCGSILLQTNGTNNGSQSKLNLAAGSNITITDGGTGTVTIAGTGGGGSTSPGGSSGQIQYNAAGSFGGFTMAGDCTLSQPNITCTKTSGTSFATSATTDTTNASNISSGTLAGARMTAVNLASSSNGGVSGNLPVTNLNSGTNANSSHYWRGDGTWATVPSGTVTSIATTAPLGGGTITTTGTLTCTTCVTATSPGAGVAHFAGSTQAVTSSAVTPSDATGNTSGSGNFCLVTSCTMTTPSIGAATGTSLIVSSFLDGQIPVTVTTGSSATLGGTYSKTLVFNENATAGAAVTYTLPTAVAGKEYCMTNANNGSSANTGTLTIQTSAAGQYIVFTDGTLSASGGYVISGGAAIDGACVTGIDSTHWMLYVTSGTWVKH